MLVIGICDSETAVRSLLTEFAERYHLETGNGVQLLCYSTGEKLLRNYMLELDLIFLEIPFRKMNGLAVAERIRQQDAGVRIVFLTTVLNYVLEAYEAGVNNYLLKPLSYAKFCREISHVLEKKSSVEARWFLEENKTGVYKIYLHHILYIETDKKHTLIHTREENITSYRQMKQHEALFAGTSLVRCHAAYLVNLRYFRKLEGMTLTMTDGTRLPVSRSRRSYVLEQIKKYGFSFQENPFRMNERQVEKKAEEMEGTKELKDVKEPKDAKEPKGAKE